MPNIISLPLHQHHCPPPKTLSQFSTVGTLSADQYIVAIILFLSVVFPLQSPCTGLVPCPLSPPLTYEMECLRICLCKFLNHLTFYCYGFLQNWFLNYICLIRNGNVVLSLQSSGQIHSLGVLGSHRKNVLIAHCTDLEVISGKLSFAGRTTHSQSSW